MMSLRLALLLSCLAVAAGPWSWADEPPQSPEQPSTGEREKRLKQLREAQEKREKAEQERYAALMNKPAPDIKGDFAINGEVVSLADLKGRVVLLDFWAVWCGPCIATFPHLREWHEKYHDQGLTILGVTSYYQRFGFDKEQGKLKRLGDQEKLSPADEQAMLKDFAAHHQLKHLLITLPADARKVAYEAYKIQGIPTAILIDRAGNVRLIKVGSGEENAKAIEATLLQLLAEGGKSS